MTTPATRKRCRSHISSSAYIGRWVGRIRTNWGR